jgi:hypothetical protein
MFASTTEQKQRTPCKRRMGIRYWCVLQLDDACRHQAGLHSPLQNLPIHPACHAEQHTKRSGNANNSQSLQTTLWASTS